VCDATDALLAAVDAMQDVISIPVQDNRGPDRLQDAMQPLP
jgi:hypothetical protein